MHNQEQYNTTTPTDDNDKIYIKGVEQLIAFEHPAPWYPNQVHKVTLSATIFRGTRKAAATDDVAGTVNYELIFDALMQPITERMAHLYGLAIHVARRFVQNEFVAEHGIRRAEVTARMDGVVAFTDASTTCTVDIDCVTGVVLLKRLEIQNIRNHCIIGVGELERLRKQPVVTNLVFDLLQRDGAGGGLGMSDDLHLFFEAAEPLEFINLLTKMIDDRQFLTLEALAHSVAEMLLVQEKCNCAVTINVYKPTIFSACTGPGVEIHRTPDHFGINRVAS